MPSPMSPSSLFPKQAPYDVRMPSIYQAYQQKAMQDEALKQAALQSQLGNIEAQQNQLKLDESRLDVPVSAAERASKLPGFGAKQKVNTARNTPEYAQSVVSGEMADNTVKVTKAQREQALLKMDTFIEHTSSAVGKHRGGDITGAASEIESTINDLEKSKQFKPETIARWRSSDPQSLMQQWGQQYDNGVNTAKQIREEQKAAAKHVRDMKLAEEKSRGQIEASKALQDAKPTTHAQNIGDIEKRYNKGGLSAITSQEADSLRFDKIKSHWSVKDSKSLQLIESNIAKQVSAARRAKWEDIDPEAKQFMTKEAHTWSADRGLFVEGGQQDYQKFLKQRELRLEMHRIDPILFPLTGSDPRASHVPTGGNKATYTQADLEHTAKKHGITVEAVKKRLGVK